MKTWAEKKSILKKKKQSSSKHVFIWVFPKIGVPQNGWFIMVPNPIKMDDLGVPLFLETPIWFLPKQNQTPKRPFLKWSMPWSFPPSSSFSGHRISHWTSFRRKFSVDFFGRVNFFPWLKSEVWKKNTIFL